MSLGARNTPSWALASFILELEQAWLELTDRPSTPEENSWPFGDFARKCAAAVPIGEDRIEDGLELFKILRKLKPESENQPDPSPRRHGEAAGSATRHARTDSGWGQCVCGADSHPAQGQKKAEP